MSEDRPRALGRGSGGRPQRVRVTGPPRHTVIRSPHLGDVHNQTPLGDLYLRSLLREQFGLAARVLFVAFGVLGAVPLIFHLAPGLAGRELLGIPVAWLLLGVLVHPFLLTLGWIYVRQVERNEAVFADLVQTAVGDDADRSAGDGPGKH